MRSINKSFAVGLIIFLCFILFNVIGVHAQCAMCRATVESSALTPKGSGKGLNTGILYLMTIPYLLIGGLGYLWYINSKRETERQNKIFNVLKRLT